MDIIHDVVDKVIQVFRVMYYYLLDFRILFYFIYSSQSR